VLCGLGYKLVNFRSGKLGDYVSHFNNTAIIWVERNLLLDDTYWPRQAYLEVMNWPDNGTRKVGRNEGAVPIRVHAVRWVFAARNAAGGWRALHWSDLVKHRDLAGKVPELPQGWGADLPVDTVETRLKKDINELDADTVLRLRDVLAKLEARAEKVSAQRQLRLLDVPEDVVVIYDGEKKSS